MTSDRVAPLREWSTRLKESRGVLVPHFDPAESGVESRVLFLLEAPRPATNASTGVKRRGSGFISVDNNDGTAENMWRARDAARFDFGALHWNIVPWYLGVASVKPARADLTEGAAALVQLLDRLDQLDTVLLAGKYAARGWDRHVSPIVGDRYRLIRTWHPSPLALNTKPDRRQEFEAAVCKAATPV